MNKTSHSTTLSPLSFSLSLSSSTFPSLPFPRLTRGAENQSVHTIPPISLLFLLMNLGFLFMAPRVRLLLFILLFLASAMVKESAAALLSEAKRGLTHFAGSDLGGRRACNGFVGDCINPDAEAMTSNEASRRTLFQGGRFIGYGALRRDNVPCNRPGASYYNCDSSGRVNPYRRGCSAITHCARYD